MKALLAVAFALTAAAALAGCSDTAPSGPVTPPIVGGAYVIHMVAGNHFTPSNAKVPVGANVTWVNDDSAVHNVWNADDNAALWHSETMSKDETYTHTFSVAGTYPYYCSIHGKSLMSATLTVG